VSAPLRVAVAAGGTSGHIHPALAVAAALRRRLPDAEILFIGTARGLEATVVPRAGFPFRPIRASGFPRRLSFAVLKSLSDLAAGRREALRLIGEFRPDVVFGTGGYVCAPVVAAANRLHVPVVLHEQNAYPGRANRMMARRARFLCTSFPGFEDAWPKRANVLRTGYPVRPEFFRVDRDEARAALGIPPDARFVLAFGGSLGARTINRAILAMLRDGPSPCGARVLLASGAALLEEVSAESAFLAGRSDEFKLVDYLVDPHLAMAAADLIVCRAGAGACSEIAALGKPSVLVPYPYAANDHQTCNARSLSDIGAAVLLPDARCDGAELRRLLDDVLSDPGRRLRMAAAAKTLACEEAADRIADLLLQAAGKGRPT